MKDTFSNYSLVINAQLQSSRHRVTQTLAEFAFNFLKLFSEFSFQFLKSMRFFTMNKVFQGPPRKEICWCKVWGACRPLNWAAASDPLSRKVFIEPLANMSCIMRWGSLR